MINRKVKKIIAILILIVMFFPNVPIDAASTSDIVKKAGQTIVDYSKSFCATTGWNSSNNQTIYDYGSKHPDVDVGDLFYLGKTFTGTATNPTGSITEKYTNKYAFECVAFVNTMIHQALGIGPEEYHNFFTVSNCDANYVEIVGTDKTKWLPGDLLRKGSKHVLIYAGGNGVIHGTYYTELDGAKYSSDYSSIGSCTAYRIKESALTGKDPDTWKTSFSGTMLSSIGSSGTESEFYFNGVPNGEYSVAGSFWDWIISALAEIFAFLVNLIFFIFRMVFVGFTAIVDNLITYIVKSIIGEEANFFQDATSGWRNDGKEETKINIETIIFGDKDESTGETNHIFDINFFKPSDTAAATP